MQDSPACKGEEQGVHVTIAPGGVGMCAVRRALGTYNLGWPGLADPTIQTRGLYSGLPSQHVAAFVEGDYSCVMAPAKQQACRLVGAAGIAHDTRS